MQVARGAGGVIHCLSTPSLIAHGLTPRGFRRTMEKSPVAPTHARLRLNGYLSVGHRHSKGFIPRVHDAVLSRAREHGVGTGCAFIKRAELHIKKTAASHEEAKLLKES